MKRYFWVIPVLLVFSGSLSANSQSQIYLRNALHYYETGDYEKSKSYFIAVLSLGTAREQRIARTYLAKPVLMNWSSVRSKESAPHHDLNPPQTENQDILPEEPLAPERQAEPHEETRSAPQPFHWSGYLREESAYRVSEPQGLSLWRSTAFTAATGQLSDDITYKVSGRLYYDAVFDLTDHYPRSVADDERTDAELRDTYIDISKGNWDTRVGKQQIVWGEAIGTFIADVVNARDLRESILPSYDFIRIPEWGSDTEYTLDNFHAEAVWLPFPVMDRIPRPGSEFAPLLPVIPGQQLVFQPEEQPSDSLKNSEVGGRLSYLLDGWDLSLFSFYTWDKEPVYLQTAQSGTLILTPTHPRITYDGATFSKEAAAVVFKGELTYTQGKYLSTTNPFISNGVLQKNIIQYLLGADHSFDSRIEANVQVSQQIIEDYDPTLFNQKPRQTSLSLQIQRPFFNERLVPSVVAITDFPYDDYLVRPYLSYKWASSWSSQIGLDIFGGSANGPFGQFSGRDRLYAEIRYDFTIL